MRALCRGGGTSVLALTRCQKFWSLQALMSAPYMSVEELLERVRRQAVTSSAWSVDFSAVLEHCPNVQGNSPMPQVELIGRVTATLASVLSANASPSVTALSVTVPTPEVAVAVRHLCRSTPLLSSVKSLELVVHTAAVGVLPENVKGTGGHEVTALLRELAAFQRRTAGRSSWTSLSVRSCDTSSVGGPALNLHAQPQHQIVPRLWDDNMVIALAELVAAAPWTEVAVPYADLTPCSPRVRQRLWKSLDSAHDSLRILELSGVCHAHEFVASRQLRHLTHLVSLDVSHTQLDEDSLQCLLRDVQAGIGGWWLLQHLGLAQCGVSEAVLALLLKQREEHMAEELPMLESINVSGVHLSCRSTFDMARCLMPCTQLRQLHTRRCHLQPTCLEDMAASLRHATGLHTWTLCLNKFGDEGVAALIKYAHCWPSLTSIDLSRCGLTCAGVHALSRALPDWNMLQSLRLAGNDLRWQPRQGCASSPSSAEAVGGLFAYDPAYMKGHGSSVKVPTSYELERRDREQGRQRYKGTEEFAEEAVSPTPPLEAFGEALSMCSQLRILDLSDCAMGDAPFVQFTTHFAGAALEELRLTANPLFATVPALDGLVEVLWRAPQLSVLDLSFTALGDLGVSMMCDGTAEGGGGVLKSMKGLHTLLISGCAIESLGWESLAAAVGQLTSLRHIALHHNRVSEVGLVEELLRELLTVSSIQSVHLLGCVTSIEAARSLQDGAEFRALRKRGVQVIL